MIRLMQGESFSRGRGMHRVTARFRRCGYRARLSSAQAGFEQNSEIVQEVPRARLVIALKCRRIMHFTLGMEFAKLT